MSRFIHKTVSMLVMALGGMFTASAVRIAIDLFGDPDNTFGEALFLSLMVFGIGFGFLYLGWRMWKSGGKKTSPELPNANAVPSGSGAPGPAGRPVPSGAGRVAPPHKPVTVECPGCGAPVEVAPSRPGVCAYCGNQVSYNRPSGNRG